jgi:hypothetical protein
MRMAPVPLWSIVWCVPFTGSYVLGLGARKPGDILVTPQGFVMFGNLLSGDSGFDHVTRGRVIGEFASVTLCHELLSVLGFVSGKLWSTLPLVAQFVTVCTTALIALRKNPTEVLVAVGCDLVRSTTPRAQQDATIF